MNRPNVIDDIYGLIDYNDVVLVPSMPEPLTEEQWQGIFQNPPTDDEMEFSDRNADSLLLSLHLE